MSQLLTPDMMMYGSVFLQRIAVEIHGISRESLDEDISKGDPPSSSNRSSSVEW
jgi:hypothetical protein